MKLSASLALAAVIIASLLAITTAEYDHCSWKLNVGGDALDPMLAPAGVKQYIITVRGDEGRRAVAKALRDLDSADITAVREMAALSNFLTVKMSRMAVRWLCRAEALDKWIVAVEADQTISIHTPK
jgi:hypothetical protein